MTPFIARAFVSLKNDAGAYAEGSGKKLYETLQSDPKYARLRQYYADVSGRDSFKETFFEDYLAERYIERAGTLRAEKKAKA